MMTDMRVNIAGVELKNPVMNSLQEPLDLVKNTVNLWISTAWAPL